VYILPREMSENTNDQQFLEKIIEYIDEHLTDNDLSVEKLASYLLMSRGNVWRKVKMLTGQTVAEFIRTIRLKKAIQLIESGKYNVSEIAYKVGFTSPAYFIKCFRTQFGKTPSEYFSKK
jgi:AraC-like DNA-binding protein